jgi:hypothetical protein
VTLDQATDVPVTVHFATQDGSALSGSDYAVSLGFVTFETGGDEPDHFHRREWRNEFPRSLSISSLIYRNRRMRFLLIRKGSARSQTTTLRRFSLAMPS